MNFPIVLAAGFIIIGLMLLIKAIVPSFQFGVFKFVVGVIIIIIGINVLFSSFSSGVDSSNFYVSSGGKQSVAFAERVIDIDKNLTGNVEFDCAFGTLTVNIPRDKNVNITSSCAFGTINLPSGNSVSFGTMNESSAKSGDVLNIKLSCAFGSIYVKYKD